jgi:hypothetical protein
MITVRELPADEWHKLVDLPIAAHGLPADDVIVMVAEDASGAIVGTWSVGPILVAEGLWVADEHQKGTALGKLYAGTLQRLSDIGVHSVYSIVQTPEMLALATHGGFEPIPGQLVNRVL